MVPPIHNTVHSVNLQFTYFSFCFLRLHSGRTNHLNNNVFECRLLYSPFFTAANTIRRQRSFHGVVINRQNLNCEQVKKTFRVWSRGNGAENMRNTVPDESETGVGFGSGAAFARGQKSQSQRSAQKWLTTPSRRFPIRSTRSRKSLDFPVRRLKRDRCCGHDDVRSSSNFHAACKYAFYTRIVISITK